MSPSRPSPENEILGILRALRGSLIFFLACSILTALAAYLIWQKRSAMEQALVQARQKFKESQALLARTHEEIEEFQKLFERYRKLVDAGRLEPERRLEWAETLSRIREEYKLLPIDYELAPQRPLLERDATPTPYEFRASLMRLRAPLVHEGDLLTLIAELKRRIPTLILVRHCQIEPVPPERREYAFAGLIAECTLDWITLRENT
ncbi:MAG: hypothetical protein N2441_04115 [Rhodocyclaceae bacterium]|nr:hypothetical protein [Rhodocyclaceae bacterium]